MMKKQSSMELEPLRRPTDEKQQRKLAIAFANWETARVSRSDLGFCVSLENGTLEDEKMIISTGSEKKDLRLIGYIVGSRGVKNLVCPESIDIKPTQPAGDLPTYVEYEEDDDDSKDRAIEAFLRKNKLLFGK